MEAIRGASFAALFGLLICLVPVIVGGWFAIRPSERLLGVMGEASRLAALGITLGLGGSFAASTVLRSLLFGVRPWDGATIAGAVAALGCAALLASYVPARRASSVNPVVALRSE